MDFPKKYNHKAREKHWQETWEANGVYHWRGDQPRENTYVIDTPPPTVSGLLHMGHIFSYTHADFVARYQRMKGKDVFYPMGFDDNGLPTERLVEKTKKIRAKDLSREEFIKVCEGVSEEARREFRYLFTTTALSVDWNQEYHTISEHARRVSQASFLDLYEKRQVYRQLQPMLWDPVDQTAIAQAEVEDKELSGTFNDITFGIKDSDETFIIGTTRPEMIPACVAIFYHPDDARYQHLKGRMAITPLFGVEVPILEDDTVEPDKGTGIMMCCTFGDEADIEKWRKHGLETRIILNQYGKLQDERLESFETLQGKKASVARENIIALLRDSGDLVESKPITHAVKCAERSGAPLEIMPTEQWFVKVLEHKDALKAKSQSCNWKPAWMQKRMEQWIDGLNWDWCISRQRYYGVPFPVWYIFKRKSEKRTVAVTHKSGTGEVKGVSEGSIEEWERCGMFYAEPDELPVNPISSPPAGIKILSKEAPGNWIGIHPETGEEVLITADKDVMDTWATSSVSPQISAYVMFNSPLEGESKSATRDSVGGQQPSTPHASSSDIVLDSAAPPQGGSCPRQKLFPADLRPQAHEIIRSWAFYTLVKSHLHHDSVPWHDLMISGWCLASDKTKMSKSKGNVVTPTALLEEKGTDAVRYWASTAKLGTDTAFSEDLLKIGNKLVTKLWNASKFAATIMGDTPLGKSLPEGGEAPLDRWMLSRIHRAITEADRCFAEYDYAGARAAVEDVFWNDFCDNYLELVKSRAYGNMGEAGQHSAACTIWHTLHAILKLFAPFVPHITEEIYHIIYTEEATRIGSIHARGNWPEAQAFPLDEAAEAAGVTTVALLELVRKAKSEKGVSIKYPIDQAVVSGVEADVLDAIADDLKAAGTISELTTGDAPSEAVTLQDDAQGLSIALTFAAQADVA